MSQNENSNPNKPEQQDNGDGKVLPFRRPSPQPTLPRRAATTPSNGPTRNKGKVPQARGNTWKGKAFQALQIALLVVGFLLALKNCGKI
jgi:hypothetical protein